MDKYYVAKIGLTVNGKKFEPGDKIRENLSEVDKKFLLSEGYIKLLEETKKRVDPAEKKPTVKESKKV